MYNKHLKHGINDDQSIQVFRHIFYNKYFCSIFVINGLILIVVPMNGNIAADIGISKMLEDPGAYTDFGVTNKPQQFNKLHILFLLILSIRSCRSDCAPLRPHCIPERLNRDPTIVLDSSILYTKV